MTAKTNQTKAPQRSLVPADWGLSFKPGTMKAAQAEQDAEE